jgi:hypothetical protein
MRSKRRDEGYSVVGVFAPPYAVDSAGTVLPTTLSLTGPNTITVNSQPGARALIPKIQRPAAKCRGYTDLDLYYNGALYQQVVDNFSICVRLRRAGGKLAFWHATLGSTHHISGRLRLALTFRGTGTGGEREIVAVSRELITPDVPKRLRTKTLYGRGTWCALLQQHTRNQNNRIDYINGGQHECWFIKTLNGTSRIMSP